MLLKKIEIHPLSIKRSDICKLVAGYSKIARRHFVETTNNGENLMAEFSKQNLNFEASS